MIYRGNANVFRIALVSFAAVAGFVAASALLLLVFPVPHTRAHFVFAGTAPSIVGLFVVLLQTYRDRSRSRAWIVRHTSDL